LVLLAGETVGSKTNVVVWFTFTTVSSRTASVGGLQIGRQQKNTSAVARVDTSG
jgi:hypothetical protein